MSKKSPILAKGGLGKEGEGMTEKGRVRQILHPPMHGMRYNSLIKKQHPAESVKGVPANQSCRNTPPETF